jgi:hypothetical protein
MATTIRNLADTLGAGARANKYRVIFSFPPALSGDTALEEVDVLAKSALAPSKEVGQIQLWNQGRKLVIPGDTVYDNTWALDFYLDESHGLRHDFVKWMDAADNFQKNQHSGNPLEVMVDLKVQQLDSMGNPTATYTLHHCFPQNVGEVTYADDTPDTVAEFNVVFSYTDWVLGTSEYSNYTPIDGVGNATTEI